MAVEEKTGDSNTKSSVRQSQSPDVLETPFAAHNEHSLSLDSRLSLVQKHGNFSLAFSTAVQPGLSYFGNHRGYLAFQRWWGNTYVLGDPVVGPEHREELLDTFLKSYRKPVFCQASHDLATLLHSRKYWVNEMGVDTRIELQSYDFSGKAKERFRYASNWLTKRNYSVQELPFAAVPREQVEAIVETWRETKSVRSEGAFLNRPFSYVDEPAVRKFFLLDPQKKAVAFVVFDPIYESGQLVGYVTSFKRRADDAPSQAEAGISKTAIEKLKDEGIERIMLGLSPLANIEDKHFRKYNPIMAFSLRSGFKAGWVNKYFYNIKGHAEYKRRFVGVEEKCYYASPTFVNDLRHFGMLRLCKII